MLISLKNTNMLISGQRAMSKTLSALKEQLNVDFTRMRDCKDAYFILKETTYMLISCQRESSEMLISLKKNRHCTC